MAAKSFRIGLIQAPAGPGPEAALEAVQAAVAGAAADGAQVICTQELFLTPYFCQTQDPSVFDLAEPIPGPTTEALSQTAREHGVVIVASLFERRAAGVHHNTAVVLDADGRLLGTYRKMHIPDDPLYYEKYYFTPGDQGFKVFDTAAGRIGVLICWDQWFPEAARLTALAGAEVIFYPTAIGWHPAERATWGDAQHSAWQTMQRAHAIANGVYVAAVNRVGHEGDPAAGLQFWGRSFVSDPFGRITAEAGGDAGEVLLADVDRGVMEEVRRNWPFLRDRRIDAYAGLERRVLD